MNFPLLQRMIQVTGTRSYSAGAHYSYAGSLAQVTGNGLPAAVNNLTIDNSAGVTFAGNAVYLVAGTLNLTNGILNISSSVPLTFENNAITVRTNGYMTGAARKNFNAPSLPAFTFPIGTANGYSPVTVNITSGTTQVTASVVQSNQPVLNPATNLRRYWTLTSSGGTFTADLTFNYLDGDVFGNENNYRLIRVSGGMPVSFPNNCISGPACVDTTLNTATINGVGNFSDWTLGAPSAPTAAPGVVTGRIVDNNGAPVEGAVVGLEGTQNRKFISDANGFYRFDNVETNGFYTVTPSRANYSFNPSARSFSQTGETTEAAFGATLATSSLQNPLDTPEYFVRQHYLDFLGREPDEAGFNFWSDQILECGSDTDCIVHRRENVSAAYFLSIEFQQTGGLVEWLYRASYGVRPDFAQFMPDTRTVGLGVQVGKEGWEGVLETNKVAFINAFVNRPAFVGVYANMDSSLFVDTLIGHTGVSFTASEREALVSGLANGTQTRADVLRSIAENNRFADAKFNDAFVMMQYFGYLRRDPDEAGFQFWLRKLNEFNGNFEQAEMVKAFIVSAEYRQRFGTP